MWDLIVSVPDHCLSFYSTVSQFDDEMEVTPIYFVVLWIKLFENVFS